MQHITEPVTDRAGNVIAGATITAFEAGTDTAVTLYDKTGAEVVDLKTDVNGVFGLSLPNGEYDIKASFGSTTTTIFEQILFEDNESDLAGKQDILSEGAFVDGDKTKLDGIETGADVTDTANVTAAGALMDSEVTNLAQVKAFDSSDYATAAQGALADSAQQPPSEGAFEDGDKDELDRLSAAAFASYAAAEAADIPAPVQVISAIVDGRVCRYVRDDDGTALTTNDGQTWSPADEVITPQHWGALGDETTDNSAAFEGAANWANDYNQTLFIPAGTYRLASQVEVSKPTALIDVNLKIVGEGNARTIITVDGSENTDGAFLIEKTPGDKFFVDLRDFCVRAVSGSGNCGVAITLLSQRTGAYVALAVYTENILIDTGNEFITQESGVDDIATPGYFTGGLSAVFTGRHIHKAFRFIGPKQIVADAGFTTAQKDAIRYADDSAHYLSDYGMDLTDCYAPIVDAESDISQCKTGIVYVSDDVAAEAGVLNASCTNVKVAFDVSRAVGSSAGVEPDLKCFSRQLAYRDKGIYIEGRQYVSIGDTLFLQQDTQPGTTDHGSTDRYAIHLENSNNITVNPGCVFVNETGVKTGYIPIYHESVDATFNPSDNGLLVNGCLFRCDAEALVETAANKGVPTVKGCHVDRSFTIDDDVIVNGTSQFIDVSPHNRRVTVSDAVIEFGGASAGQTYSSRDAGYIIEGRTVTWWCDIRLSAKGSSTGTATIAMSLPQPRSGADYGATVSYSAGFPTQGPNGGLLLASGEIQPLYLNAATNLSQGMDAGDFTNSSQIRMSGTYERAL
ncbi:glycosyl hydrolase family 28-related protein [Roseovarius sp. MMSF_3350]|uniref:glycosyl hydrolase family 28-related protein n=1 Tax=Roseovarius sp. MMSF_3350 TaxID=3046706 RepID=UPI00273D68E3|nr:glycosyl hydrolase family 28-related protein [Roseovarius sp. MMSF_3350]